MAREHSLIGIALTGTPGAAVVPTFGKQSHAWNQSDRLCRPHRRNPPFVLNGYKHGRHW